MVIKSVELGKRIDDDRDNFIKEIENIRMHNRSQRAEEYNN